MKQFIILLKPYRWLIVIATLLGAMTIGSNIGLLAASAILISSAALHPPILDLMTLIVGVRFFGISRAVLRYLERYFTHDITFRILKDIRVWFYQKLEPLAPARLMKYGSGDILSRIFNDVETLKFFYLKVLAAPLVAVVVLIATAMFLSFYSWSVALILIIFFLLAGLVIPLIMGRISHGIGKKNIELKGKFNIEITDMVLGMGDLLTYDIQKQKYHQVLQSSKRLITGQKKLANLTGISNALINLMMHLALWCTLILVIPLIEMDILPGIYLAMLPLVVLGAFEAALPLTMVFQQYEESMKATERLQEIMDSQPLIDETSGKPILVPNYAIEIDKLSFIYSREQSFTLSDINLSLPHGKKIAIIGPSGAGKSTIFNILLRFWQYNEGSIKLGGVEVKEFSPEDFRSVLGVMGQKTYLFNGTILENILVTKPDATLDEVIRCCKKAQIYQFIENLPLGFNAYIGEDGLRLSGGQRQRIALVRVLLKNTPIMLLDEVTSSLDYLTEKTVLDTILDASSTKSILFITHRLTNLQRFDEIIVLDKGKIVERGEHDRLLEKGGLYHKMWHLQRQIIEEKME